MLKYRGTNGFDEYLKTTPKLVRPVFLCLSLALSLSLEYLQITPKRVRPV